jgi:AcrR family transcriptional regulator
MPPQVVVNPRKSPRQKRAQVTVEAILTATTHILVHEGYKSLSTNRVAKVAGVSIGSLYQYFPNKEALLTAIVDNHVQLILQTMEQHLEETEGSSFETLIRVLLKGLMDAHSVNPELHRVLKEEVSQQACLSSMRDFEKTVLDLVRTTLEERHGELRPIDPEVGSFIISYVVEAVLRATVVSKEWQKRTDEIFEEMVHLVTSYLKPC